jgi:hypothetical protein
VTFPSSSKQPDGTMARAPEDAPASRVLDPALR